MTAHRRITLTCDGTRGGDSPCLADYGVPTDDPVATVRLLARYHGWRHDATGRDLCPDCAGTNQ